LLFIPFKKDKSPSFPLFLRGKIRQVISPLWKKGVRGDFILLNLPLFPFLKGKKKKTNPPSSPFFKGGKEIKF